MAKGCLGVLAWFPVLLSAADERGGITGRVSNDGGAVVAGARITATHLGTYAVFTARATQSGEFTLPSLPAGSYRVSVEAGGFQPFIYRGVRLQAGDTIRLETHVEAVVPRVSPFSGLAHGRGAPAGRPRPNTSAQASYGPSVVKQFEETSYYLRSIILIDSNTGWAVGEPHWDQTALQYKGTIAKTTNGGTAWTAQEAGAVEEFRSVHFINANQGWVVGTNATILHTTDGGTHWTRQTVGTADDFCSVFFIDANNGWATSTKPVHYWDFAEDFDDWQGSIWHTSDGGQTWAQQTVPYNTSLLNRIEFIDSRTGWAAGLKLTGYSTLTNNPEHLGAIYGTTDGGRTWTEIFATSSGFTFTALDFVDASNGWAAGFPHNSGYNGTCTFHTADGGKTWQGQSAGSFFALVRDLHFLDRNRGYAVGTDYTGDGTAVWRTLDGGATWTPVYMQNTNPITIEGLWAVGMISDTILIVGDRDFQAKSTRAWDSCGTLATCGSHCSCLFSQSYINPHYIFHDVFFADTNNGWVAGTRTFAPNLWGQVILATQDSGRTWITQYEHAPRADRLSSAHRLDSIHFTDTRNGWAVGNTEQYLNSKGGWEEHGAILHTADGGRTWTEQGTDICVSIACEFSAVQFIDSQNGWALSAKTRYPGGAIQLAHTTDGGNHWSWVDTGVSSNVAVGFASVQGGMFFADAQHGWVAGISAVAGTSNGGSSWSNEIVNCGATGGTCYLDGNAVAFSDARSGWIAGNELYQTTDGGGHWSKSSLKVEAYLEDVQFVNPATGWLAGDGGLLLETHDSGGHWVPVASGTSVALLGLHFPSLQRGWIVGDYGTILSYASDRIPAGTPAIFSVVNSASFRPPIAPATWISIFGANLSVSARPWNTSDFEGDKLPTQLDGVSVDVNGRAAYVSYISPGQVNALVPDGSVTGSVPVEVVTSRVQSGFSSIPMTAYAPALSRLSVEGGCYVIAQTTDGMLVGSGRVASALGTHTNVREARPGEIVTLYGTGFGSTDPPLPTGSLVNTPAALAAPVTFRFGRTVAPVVWSGLIAPGLYQFNIRIPDVHTGNHVIVAEIAGYYSQGDSVISVRQ